MGKIIEYLLEIYPIIAYICLIVYLPRLRYYLDAFKKQKKIINFKFEKLSLIIPAREEALIIANLFETIKAQNYPLDSFDVHIIVDNENDETIKIAKEYFTNLYIHIIKEQKCKGDALDGCFKWILEHKKDYYSAHIIVDAD
ncbi:MAG: glycosyltransferase, partial [Bacillales bacterium]|nr:glycosyltransferase [Bacillales bacterium]